VAPEQWTASEDRLDFLEVMGWTSLHSKKEMKFVFETAFFIFIKITLQLGFLLRKWATQFDQMSAKLDTTENAQRSSCSGSRISRKGSERA
jgi:hypothetical protein